MNEYEYSIQEAKNEIKDSIRVYLKKDEKGQYILPSDKKNPFYVVGLPGIGKTEMVRQISEELGLGFYATSLTHHTRNSILGLPVITSVGDEKSTEYTMPDIIAQIEKQCSSGKKEGILLIDEFASMSEALVAPMLAFLQNKCIGNHRLPEGWIMVLCSNPPEYNETARRFDAAVMDRVRLMNVSYSLKDFLEYAEKTGMHELIVDFIKQKNSAAYHCEKNKGIVEIVTARSWENLSLCIEGYEALGMDVSEKLVYQFIKSEKLANEFFRYYMLATAAFGKKEFDNIEAGRKLDEYAERVGRLAFDKKWQIAKLLGERLYQENAVFTREYQMICTDDKKLTENAEHIENSIRFVKMLGDMDITESFIRLLNKNNSVLYVLTKRKCPEYTAVMVEVLGVDSESLVS